MGNGNFEVKRYDVCGEHYEVYGDRNGDYVLHEDYAKLEAQVKQLAADRESFAVECAAARIALAYWKEGRTGFTLNTPSVDAFLSRLRNEALAEAIPEGYALVPQEMCFSAESMEGICFHCGDGGHMFGDFTDGVLYVGEVDYGDGKKIHGLHIATADCPEEGCATICEFLPVLREGKAAPQSAPLSAAITDIIAERQRQQSVEGWTPEHDDEYEHGELADAAGCYALSSELFDCVGEPPRPWPWPNEWWKPTSRRRDLVKSGALIAAEIERIDRAEGKAGEVCNG